jgi:hypothetical protein
VDDCSYRTPASRRAFWRIVSFTAAKTRRMFPVSVACVKLVVSDGNQEKQRVRYCG